MYACMYACMCHVFSMAEIFARHCYDDNESILACYANKLEGTRDRHSYGHWSFSDNDQSNLLLLGHNVDGELAMETQNDQSKVKSFISSSGLAGSYP